MLRFLTAGESHGSVLTGILEGIPAGLSLSASDINTQLARRQAGYGRGERMALEKDEAEITSGVWKGRTTGAPISLSIKNRSTRPQEDEPLRTIPRPGHADLAGMIKYAQYDDYTPVLERASARETTMRVAIGAVTMRLLREFEMEVVGYLVGLGSIRIETPTIPIDEIKRRRDASPFYCLNPDVESQMKMEVDLARSKGDTLGGVVEVNGFNIPPGLGSYVHYDRRLDGRIGAHLLSIPSCKGIEIGYALLGAGSTGRDHHDAILREESKIGRTSNRAGGLEGGVTNGQPLVVRAYFKPISTLRNPLPSVDLSTGNATTAPYIRSDVTVVPAASVIAESLVAFVLCDAMLERFGGDTLEMMKASFTRWQAEYQQRMSPTRGHSSKQ